MKRYIAIIVLLISIDSFAQTEVTDSIGKYLSLDEVVISASNITRVNDHLIIYPNDQQRKHTNNGYGVLKNLMIPGLIINQSGYVEAMGMLWKAGIEIPAMYKMGYNNNNCIGCVKGGMGYWNKIRKDFPEVFARMAQIEREVGATCLKDQSGKIFLDELSPNRGEMPEEFIPDCSLICQIEFQEILDRQVERVLKREVSINDVR